MADTLDVLSLAEGKQAVNITTTDHDDEIARHITAVSRILDAECGPVVQRTITAEIHQGRGTPSLWVNHPPVVSVTTVREAIGGTITNLSAVAFGGTTDGYYLNPDLMGQIGRRYGGQPSAWGRDSQVEFTYVAGRYANTAAVDARFKTCAASILRRLWKREAGTWAQSSDFFEQIDPQSPGIGFYRVARPIIDDLLPDQRKPPSIG